MINWQVGSNRRSLEWSMVYFGKKRIARNYDDKLTEFL